MKEIVLKPVPPSSEKYEEVEAALVNLMREEIYLPILKSLKSNATLKNSIEDLISAIDSGRITFHRGEFRGRFSSRVSKELKARGAIWKNGAWKINLHKLPITVRSAIQTSEIEFKRAIGRIDEMLAKKLPEEIADKINLEKIYDSTLWKAEKDFKISVKGVIVPPDLTKEQRKAISEEYTHDMQRYIKEWSEKEIVRLRKEVQEQIFVQGNRRESIEALVKTRYDVSKSKAKFLARQETSLLMAKFHETRYKSAGIEEYKWVAVPGTKLHPTRPAHKALDGKTFRWDDPPITTAPGEPIRRNNPGQDYNCRCSARPIVRFA